MSNFYKKQIVFFTVFIILLSLNLQKVQGVNHPSTDYGTLFYETFDNFSNWQFKNGGSVHYGQIVNGIQGSDNVINWTKGIGGGDQFTKDTFNMPSNHNQFWLIMDYLDNGVDQLDCLIYVGETPTNTSCSHWFITGEGSTYEIDKYYVRQKWYHHEYLFTPVNNQFYIALEDNKGVGHSCFMDNLIVSSFHGPDKVRVDPRTHIQPGFEVLSVDYTGYTSTSTSQFNFDVATVNELLGRDSSSTFTGEQFAIYIPAKDIIDEVLLYSTNNGGSIGDGYGRFKNDVYGTNQQFNPGDYIFFDNNFSVNKGDYQKETGTCKFDGPFRHYEYDTCVDECIDYETLEVAMFKCQEYVDCLGITYTHKFWEGGSKSQGYENGYGYQLRKGNLVLKSDRHFVHSWTQKSISPDQYQYRTEVQCRTYQVGVIWQDTFEDLSKWMGKNKVVDGHSGQIVSKNGNDSCITLTQQIGGGDIFSQEYFQRMPYIKDFYFMFDYLIIGTQSSIYYGHSKDSHSFHTWFANSKNNNYAGGMFPNVGEKWNHHVFKWSSDWPFYRQMIEDFTGSNNIYMDNIVVPSPHGYDIVNRDPLLHMQPGFQILSIDFTGYNGTPSSGNKFHFRKSEVDTILERSDWDNEVFALYNVYKDTTQLIVLHQGNNGGSIGNAWGELQTEDNSVQQFGIGEWMIFDNNFSKNTGDFTLETGVCSFDGPFRKQEYSNCVQDCKDFENFTDAIDACFQDSTCQGVTYAHKLWGGSASTGFTLGYGYQLRKGTLVENSDRLYMYTFKKVDVQEGQYYSQPTLKCSICDYKCVSCLGTATNCQTCADSSNRLITPDCECKIGYLDTGVATCQKCNYTCSSCNTNINTCSTCSHNTRDSDNNCVCKDTYYNVGTNAECQQCSHPCVNCQNSDTECKSCVAGTKRLGIPTCGCENGYFDDGTNANCQQCSHQCAKCSGSADNCDECIVRDNSNSTPSCTCSVGYYEDSDDKSCKKCPAKCTKCSDATTCTECASGTGRLSLSNNCNCDDGYFDNLTNVNCVQCTYPCQNCQSESVCDSCVDQINREDKPSCLCKQGYYDNNGSCEICQYPCQNCSSSPTNCESCKTTLNRGFTPNCQCSDNFYDDGSECQACQHPCITCTDVNVCTGTCGGILTNRNTYPTCTCEDGYYEDLDDKTCKKCLNKCKKCTNATSCTECETGTGRLDLSNQCNCEDGYYDDLTNKNCAQCDSQCNKCSGSQNNCSECKNTENRSTNSDCSCLQGFYNDSNDLCVKCDQQCKTCSNQADNCEECIDGYYMSAPGVCSKCSYKCNTCESTSTNCISCFNDLRDDSNSDCNCKQGYIDTGVSECQICDIQCKSCSGSASQCDECSDINRDDQNDCNCKDGYYSNVGESKCLKCKYPCVNCYSETQCKSCFYSQVQSLPSCKCSIGYYDSGQGNGCDKCSEQCQACEKKADNCTMCNIQINSLNRLNITPDCGCKEGYYNENGNLSDKCLQCPSQCVSCKNSKICTECILQGAQPPLCEDIQQNNSVMIKTDNQGNIQVVECEKQCQECENQSYYCKSCNVGINRSQNPPDCSCKIGYHDNEGSQLDCQKCNPLCLECISQQKCTKCSMEMNREIDTFTMQCKCLKGYKEISGSYTCQKCFTYKGQCFLECPKNTIKDEQLQACTDQSFNIQNESILIYALGCILVTSNIIIFGILHKCIKNKMNSIKNINNGNKQVQQSSRGSDSSV